MFTDIYLYIYNVRLQYVYIYIYIYLIQTHIYIYIYIFLIHTYEIYIALSWLQKSRSTMKQEGSRPMGCVASTMRAGR